jgi:3D (Asp-Asp-Asp) domain-containing protein
MEETTKILTTLLLVSLFMFMVGTLDRITKLNSKLEGELTLVDDKIEYLSKRMLEYESVVDFESVKNLTVTAYSPTKDQCDSDPHITASMLPVKEGTIAVSRDLFESGWVFGKTVYIKGLGIFEIRDLMNERYTNRADVFMWKRKAANKFGKKTLTVALLNL